jgi:hypothetical protein
MKFTILLVLLFVMPALADRSGTNIRCRKLQPKLQWSRAARCVAVRSMSLRAPQNRTP